MGYNTGINPIYVEGKFASKSKINQVFKKNFGLGSHTQTKIIQFEEIMQPLLHTLFISPPAQIEKDFHYSLKGLLITWIEPLELEFFMEADPLIKTVSELGV